MNAQGPPLVSVCIVTFGAFELVQATIQSVRANTSVPFQLIVVDNGSTDGTREWLQANLDENEYIESPVNSGFAGGNNLAVNAALAPFVCLLNSDTVVPPGWLEPLMRAFSDDPKLGIAVPVLLNVDGTVQEAGCNTDTDGRAEPLFYGESPDDPRLAAPRTIAYGSAACWLMRTDTYRSLGGLDCGYGTVYYEDVDFAFTVRGHGKRVQLVPEVKVVHAQGASSNPDTAVKLRDSQQQRFANRHAHNLAHHCHVYDIDREPYRFAAARDVDSAQRTLHVLQDSDELQAINATMHAQMPFQTGHHTLCILEPRRDGPRNFETACDRADITLIEAEAVDKILHDYLFHFSAIVAPQQWIVSNIALLDATQPQAQHIART